MREWQVGIKGLVSVLIVAETSDEVLVGDDGERRDVLVVVVAVNACDAIARSSIELFHVRAFHDRSLQLEELLGFMERIEISQLECHDATLEDVHLDSVQHVRLQLGMRIVMVEECQRLVAQFGLIHENHVTCW